MLLPMEPGDLTTVEQVAGNPTLLRVGLFIAVAVAVATAVPKILGPISGAWSDWLDDWRSRARRTGPSRTCRAFSTRYGSRSRSATV